MDCPLLYLIHINSIFAIYSWKAANKISIIDILLDNILNEIFFEEKPQKKLAVSVYGLL